MVRSSNVGLGNQKDEKIYLSSGIGWFILKREGKALYFGLHTCTCLAIWIATFPYKFCILRGGQLWKSVHCCENVYTLVFPAIACSIDKGERYIEENEHADSFSLL
jgi:hypothetical protein